MSKIRSKPNKEVVMLTLTAALVAVGFLVNGILIARSFVMVQSGKSSGVVQDPVDKASVEKAREALSTGQ